MCRDTLKALKYSFFILKKGFFLASWHDRTIGIVNVSGWMRKRDAKIFLKKSYFCQVLSWKIRISNFVYMLIKFFWRDLWMRSCRVVRTSDSQCRSRCRSRNCPGFDPSQLRHNGIWGAADEAVYHICKEKNLLGVVVVLNGLGIWYRYHTGALPYRYSLSLPINVPFVKPLKDNW